ncbi:MAG: hypothetical protein JW895_02525 [Thermoleophilaceae bacterium]|nr:hypothetical protein [Thermoleophilaceae bacterium]
MSARIDPAVVLAEPVFAGGRSKPFAELTAAEVAERAQELRDVTGWGPTAKVGSVARAWGELARTMEERGVAIVGELDPAAVSERAERLWVVPPGGSLL